MKSARVMDQDNGRFCLEYEDTLGRTNSMRLDAVTYETAIREARFFLGINPENLDSDGNTWEVE